MKWLAQQLVRKDMAASRCATRPDLPWTANMQPNQATLFRMREVCAGCLVQDRCARIGVDALGGMYAGVWLPWKDEKGFPGVRTARGELRGRVAALSDEMAT
jgi:hypothetical protein